jgi:multiple sugar transport system substrate-binding protein
MSKLTTLTGLTWDHPRAWTGLFAETERYNLNQTDVVLT